MIREHIKESLSQQIKESLTKAPEIRDKTDVELLELMENSSVESAIYRHCATMLQLRSMQSTLIASNRLVRATWVLALITGLLVAISFFR
jgi:hypothetical protein